MRAAEIVVAIWGTACLLAVAAIARLGSLAARARDRRFDRKVAALLDREPPP